MCGIAGWIDWEHDMTKEEAILEKMTETLAHRGPDASGIWMSKRAGLGHRRLCVVDPEGGGQPMTRRLGDRSYTIVYNGELYNTPELRHELETRGHTFYSRSDTEALLLSYIEWGPACVERFNGIYAFAIWDEAEQRLFMARDRMGVKPLFYSVRGNALLFASELKALFAHPMIKPEIDEEGLSEIFGLGPARTPGHGVFCGIKEVKPGFSLIYDRGGVRTCRYWTLESKPHEDDLDTTIVHIRDLLEDSIIRQLVSDVPLCTFLSGGLDSSAISAFAAKGFLQEGKGQLHTYSIDYVDNDKFFQASDFQPNSDAPWVEQMTRFLGTHHHNILVDTPQLVEALREAVIARGLPGMADIDSSLLLFCKEIKKFHTVALSGECADEVFGGYPWFHRQDLMDADMFPWSNSTKERANILSQELKEKLDLENYVRQRYQDTLDEVPRLKGEDTAEARRREMFYLNIVWFMQTLLDRKDRMSMAASLEVRVPFCDHRLVEYVWNIPWNMKTFGGREKGILRQALKGILPEEVIERKKSPYPKTHNPNYTRAMIGLMRQILDDASSPLLPLIDRKVVREMTETGGASFKKPWYGQLMTGPQLLAHLAQIDMWLREYKVAIK